MALMNRMAILDDTPRIQARGPNRARRSPTRADQDPATRKPEWSPPHPRAPNLRLPPPPPPPPDARSARRSSTPRPLRPRRVRARIGGRSRGRRRRSHSSPFPHPPRRAAEKRSIDMTSWAKLEKRDQERVLSMLRKLIVDT